MKRRILGSGLAAITLLACGSDVGDTAAQILEDAGQVLEDAGQVLADAGHAIADSGTADAQADSGSGRPTRRVLDQTCDQVRTVTGPQYAQPLTQAYAVFSESAEDVVGAWVCEPNDRTTLDCPSGATCTGAVVPKARCMQTNAVEAEDGRVWVQCAQWGRAKLVLD